MTDEVDSLGNANKEFSHEEAAYRRGAQQAVAFAANLINQGATGEDIAEYSDLLGRWRAGSLESSNLEQVAYDHMSMFR